jgi:copper(I)-binding protein
MFRHGLAAAACALAALLAGCGPGSAGNGPAAEASATGASASATNAGIALSDARVQLPVIPGRPGAAYVTVRQASGPARTIAAVGVQGAGRSEMHQTTEENGVARMAPVDKLPLAAGQTVRFAPGGYHVMLFDLDPALKAGGTTSLTVSFADGTKASIAAPVTAAGNDAMGAMH